MPACRSVPFRAVRSREVCSGDPVPDSRLHCPDPQFGHPCAGRVPGAVGRVQASQQAELCHKLLLARRPGGLARRFSEAATRSLFPCKLFWARPFQRLGYCNCRHAFISLFFCCCFVLCVLLFAMISVIMPCRNGMPFLPWALDDLASSSVALEVLVCDDGSSDGSAEWLQRLHTALEAPDVPDAPDAPSAPDAPGAPDAPDGESWDPACGLSSDTPWVQQDGSRRSRSSRRKSKEVEDVSDLVRMNTASSGAMARRRCSSQPRSGVEEDVRCRPSLGASEPCHKELCFALGQYCVRFRNSEGRGQGAAQNAARTERDVDIYVQDWKGLEEIGRKALTEACLQAASAPLVGPPGRWLCVLLRGWGRSQGLMDADDRGDPERFQKLLDALKDHRDWIGACSQVRIFGTVSEACAALV